MTLLTRLGGHLVQGHVDGVGEVAASTPSRGRRRALTVRVPAELLRYVVEKGSITVDGVSLTVAGVARRRFDGRPDPAHAGRDHARHRTRRATR